jgi:hypothetical protein
MGEDTALGIRAWHLTLPISSRTQWLVKLGVAVFVAALLVLALPAVLVRLPGLVMALPAGTVLLPANPQVFLTLTGLLLLSFWASTLFGHTIRAAVATGFAALTVAACVNAAMWTGQRWRVGSELLTGYMVNQQLPPDALTPQLFRQFRSGALIAALCLVALIGLRQSLAAFRRIDLGRRAIARASVVLACAAGVLTFIPFAYFWAASDQYRSEPVRELTASLAVVTSAETSAGAFPERVTIAQLEATGLLSDATRRWIAGSDISLSAMPQHSTSRRLALAKLTFPGGHVYRFFYEVPRADR